MTKRKKRIIVITVVSMIVLSVLAAIAFYSVAFVKGDQLVRAACTGDFPMEEDAGWVTRENVQKLAIVEDGQIPDDAWVTIQKGYQFRFLALNRLRITFDVTVLVQDEDTLETIDRYRGIKVVDFVFQSGEWEIDRVETVR